MAHVLGGCTGDDQGLAAESEGTSEFRTAQEALTTVDDALALSAEDRKLLYDAQFESVRRCMAAKGFTYKVPTFYDDDSPTALQFEVGPPDEETASIFGYRTASEVDPPPADAGNQDVGIPEDPAQAAAFLRALDGTAPAVMNTAGPTLMEDGCFPESWNIMYKGRAEERELLRLRLTEVANAIYSSYLADPQIVALNQAWSNCVAESGYTYSSPRTAREYWLSLKGDLLSPDEIAAARADVACKARLSYLAEVRAVVLRLQAEEDPELEAELLEYVSLKEDSIAVAKELMGLST